MNTEKKELLGIKYPLRQILSAALIGPWKQGRRSIILLTVLIFAVLYDVFSIHSLTTCFFTRLYT